MGSSRFNLRAAAIAVATALVAASTATAAMDRKTISASDCTAYAPDTASGELVITPNGIYNPGTSIEKVICPLPHDQELGYVAGDLYVAVVYRVLGGTPGRVTCTLFVGSTTLQTAPVHTATASGPLIANGSRADLSVEGAPQAADTTVTNTLVCAISPKTSLGGIYVHETGATQIVDPPG